MKPALRVAAIALLASVMGTAPVRAETKPASVPAKGGPDAVQLPRYTPPDAYSEDLVVNSQGKTFVIQRFVDHGKVRTEMNMEGKSFVMIETGDEHGTTYTVMPDMKMVMKQTSQTMETASEMAGHPNKAQEHAEKELKKHGEKGSGENAEQAMPGSEGHGPETPPANMKVEDLGQETIGGLAAKKFRMTSPDGDAVGWFDPATNAPMRMEGVVNGQKQSIEWKNRKTGSQPSDLFQIPKDYKVQDMDAMMAQMKSAEAMGGAGNMMKAMAGGMGQSMGSSLGGSLGASLGGAVGGPLWSMAGQYIGGKIGGLLGRKAGSAL